MMDIILDLIKKYRSFIAYDVFGVFTTIVNIATYNLSYNSLGFSNTLSNVTAWFLAVTFAYLTNKVWVFGSPSWKWEVLKKEVTAFISCRLATGLLDIVIMYVCVDVLCMHALLMKVISNILVIVLNYIFSKLVIFKKK